MPVWWGRKSSKSKEEQLNPYGSYQQSLAKSGSKKKGKDKPRSFDEVSAAAIQPRNSPRASKDFSGGSSGFSGFDSDSAAEKKGHPLPRPSVSSVQGIGIDHATGLGSGSVSVSSSVSSSGSSDDHAVAVDHGQLQFGGHRGNGDIKFNVRARSPCTGSRPATSPSSPLHPRLSGMSLDSPKQEDGRNQLHPLPLPPGSPTGRTLSKWKKGKLLGRGTFGHVYVGFNSEGGQMCAIKEVKVVSDDQTSKECLKQLNQEINLLSQLSHQNIVRYHGSELGEEALSVYLEYVSGGSIHKLLQDYGAFKEPVIQNYTRQILSGLAYLHGRSTVHRDIKGANILVGPNGEIKLADFGMAKHITNCCSMLSFKGSPYWMAPEVVMNTNGYNLAVDIWSLGCTILEMASAKPPWSQYEGVAAIFKIGNSKDIPEIPDHLSNDAKSFVRLCLQRDPLARPTAAQLLDHPFIRDQATRVANVNVTKDAFPFASDGSRTSPTLELRSNRRTLCDGDYTRKPAAVNSRNLISSRENVRTITSLPVSPSSSPLRNYGPAHKSCFLSPPHPTFATMGQSSYNLNDYSLYPRPKSPTSPYTLDPFQDATLFKAQTPGGSPRRLL